MKNFNKCQKMSFLDLEIDDQYAFELIKTY